MLCQQQISVSSPPVPIISCLLDRPSSMYSPFNTSGMENTWSLVCLATLFHTPLNQYNARIPYYLSVFKTLHTSIPRLFTTRPVFGVRMLQNIHNIQIRIHCNLKLLNVQTIHIGVIRYNCCYQKKRSKRRGLYKHFRCFCPSG